MAVEDDLSREARVKLWRAGRKLSEAWRTFGDDRQKLLHSDNRGTGTALVSNDEVDEHQVNAD